LPKSNVIGKIVIENELSDFQVAVLNNSIHDYTFTGVFHLLSNFLDDYIEESDGNILERMIRTDDLGISNSFVLPPNHRFYAAFSQSLEQLMPTGIINHYSNENKDLLNKKRFESDYLEFVKPMSMDHLESGFIVWLLTLGLPIVAYIFELVATFKDYLIFKCIFMTYIESLERNPRTRSRTLQKALVEMQKINKYKLSSETESSNRKKNSFGAKHDVDAIIVEEF
jgi:hypothetical protein